MKKVFLMCSIAGAMYACSPKTDSNSANNVPKEVTGFTIENSENIELSKKSAKYIETGDTAAYRATYSKDAIIHENSIDETVDQNMAAINSIRAAGASFIIDTGAIYFETKYFKPHKYTNFVHGYMVMILKKGDKQLRLNMHSVDAIKDGLQVEEWLYYDTKGVEEFLK
jgi:hypothetical protein